MYKKKNKKREERGAIELEECIVYILFSSVYSLFRLARINLERRFLKRLSREHHQHQTAVGHYNTNLSRVSNGTTTILPVSAANWNAMQTYSNRSLFYRRNRKAARNQYLAQTN
jgi:hypothetical protein